MFLLHKKKIMVLESFKNNNIFKTFKNKYKELGQLC